MMMRMLQADWIKIGKTWTIWLVFLGPLGLLLCQGVNYGIRSDYLLPFGWEGKDGFFYWVNALLPSTLLLGSALLASIVSGHEHDAHAWKQLFALPISRVQVMFSKGIWLAICLAVSSALSILLLGLLGIAVGLPTPVPWKELTRLIIYPYLAVYPVLALQLWLSFVMKGQAWPIIVGVAGTMFSGVLAASQTGYWLIWAYPVNAGLERKLDFTPLFSAGEWALLGIGLGLMITWIGAIHFSRKEVQ